jgi:hypothetical protein
MDLTRREDLGGLARCDNDSLPSLFCLKLCGSDRSTFSMRFLLDGVLDDIRSVVLLSAAVLDPAAEFGGND